MTDPINIMQAASDEWCSDFDGFDSSRSHFVAIKKGLEDAGFVIVPVEPTEAMEEQGAECIPVTVDGGLDLQEKSDGAYTVYKAMIKAAKEVE